MADAIQSDLNSSATLVSPASGSVEGQYAVPIAGNPDSGNGNGQAQNIEPDVQSGQPEETPPIEFTQEEYTKMHSLGLIPQANASGITSYQNLRNEFNTNNNTRKALEENFNPYGGFENALAIMKSCADDPHFAEYVKARQERENYNVTNVDEITDEQREYNALVEAKVDQRIKPLEEKIRGEHIRGLFDQLNKGKYSKEWKKYEPEMVKEIANWPEKKRNNPTLKDLENSFFNAINNKGDMDNFLANGYKQELESKKRNISQPANRVVPAGNGGNRMTPQEAHETALRENPEFASLFK